MKSKKIFTLLSGVALATALFSCKNSHNHEFELIKEVTANCKETGVESHYKCKSCNKLYKMDKTTEIADISEITIPVDKNNHKGTKVLSVKSAKKTNYKVFDTVDIKDYDFVWKCEHCEGTSLTETEISNITITYPTSTATSFTSEDVGKDNIAVTFTMGSFKATSKVTVGLAENTITGLVNINKNCGYTGKTLKEDLSKSVTSTTGQVSFKIATTKDGEYKDITDEEIYHVTEGQESTKWYIKAESQATSEYDKATAGPVDLTITHSYAWNTDDPDADYYGCKCKPESVVMFKKKPTNGSEIILTNTSATLSLEGSGYTATGFSGKCTIKSISVKNGESTIDLGSDLTLSETAITALKNANLYGTQNIEVVVEHGAISEGVVVAASSHTIVVPTTIVTKEITTAVEIREIIAFKADQTVAIKVGGYYRIADSVTEMDATVGSGMPAYESDKKVNTFVGIFDGNGKTIKTQSRICGLFGALEGATIENVTINDIWTHVGSTWASCILGLDVNKSTIKNVTIKATGGNDQTIKKLGPNEQGYGWVVARVCNSTSFIGCDFDASNKGKNVTTLVGSHPSNVNITFKNSTFECNTYYCVYQQNNPDAGATEPKAIVREIDGLLISSNEEAGTTRVDVDLSTATTFSLTVPEKYSAYTVEEIYVLNGANKIDLGTNTASITIPSTIKETTTLHGENNVFVKFGKTGKAILTVKFPVLFATQIISTVAQVQALTHYASKSESQKTITGYYLLNNDLNFNDDSYTEFNPWDSSAPIKSNIFSGTFDGNGKTITSKTRLYGLFGETSGAKFKNFTILDAWSKGGSDQNCSLLALDAKGSTISNVNFKCTAMGDYSLKDDIAAGAQSYGWVVSRVTYNTTFDTCTFDDSISSTACTHKIQFLLGCHSATKLITFKSCTMKCLQYYALYRTSEAAGQTMADTTTADGITITGECVHK